MDQLRFISIIKKVMHFIYFYSSAAAWGHFETVTILIESGANLNHCNKKGWSPLDYAYSLDMKDHIEGNLFY